MKFTFKFTKKRILAMCEALLAIAIFFTYFVPSVYYATSVKKTKEYFNGFEAYLGGDKFFNGTTFGGVFFIILLSLFAIVCITKVFISFDKTVKKLNILAICIAVVAFAFIVHAPCKLMCNPVKTSGTMFYYVGAWIQIGLTAGLIGFVALDQWVIKD